MSRHPPALPALLRARRVSEDAASVGFDWPDPAGVRAKLDEELDELDRAVAEGDVHAITDELGDVLFTVVNLARHLQVEAEVALHLATSKFEDRFRGLERRLAALGRTFEDTPADELERLWRSGRER